MKHSKPHLPNWSQNRRFILTLTVLLPCFNVEESPYVAPIETLISCSQVLIHTRNSSNYSVLFSLNFGFVSLFASPAFGNTFLDIPWHSLAFLDIPWHSSTPYDWLCMTLYDSVSLCITLYHSVWLSMTLCDSVWLFMILYNSHWTLFDHVWLCLTMLD